MPQIIIHTLWLDISYLIYTLIINLSYMNINDVHLSYECDLTRRRYGVWILVDPPNLDQSQLRTDRKRYPFQSL